MLKKATLTALIALVAVFYGILGSEAAQFPKPDGYVNDFAGVLKSGTSEQLEGVLRGLASKSGAEVVVVTVKDMGGIDESTYAVELMKEWGIGSKERDDGILILVAVEERRLRIEVGYGLEHVITDAAAGQIRDKYIVPHLKNNDYDTGIRQGALAVASIIAEDRGIELGGTMPVARSPVTRRKSAPFFNLFFILMFFLIFILSGRRGGRGLLMGMLLGSMLGGGRRGHYGGGFGGGFGGSGGGGGFGGFGGGFSGGGGASGGF